METKWNNIFRPNILPPGSYPSAPGNQPQLGTITKPPYQTDEEDDNDDTESYRNYNVPQQTLSKAQPRGTINSEDTYASSPSFSPGKMNPSNAPPRGTSTGFSSDSPLNNNRNPSSNINNSPASRFPSQSNFPVIPTIVNASVVNPTPTSRNNPPPSFSGLPPGMNPNESATSAPNNPSSSLGGFPPGMNTNQSSAIPATNPMLSLFGGAPSGTNTNQAQTSPQQQPLTNDIQPPMIKLVSAMKTNQTSPPSATTIPQLHQTGGPSLDRNTKSFPSTQIARMNDTNNPMNTQQGSLINREPSFRNRAYDDDNVSRLELDYPIENVLVDAGIPATVAIKINEIVEQDRLGKAYHIRRYTYEPPVQRISIGNNQYLNRRLNTDTYYGGTRYIREIQNDDRNVVYDNTYDPQRSNKYYQRRRSYSESSLNRYIDQLIQTPGSIVIQAENYQNLQDILGQYLYNDAIMPTQSSISPPYLPLPPPPPPPSLPPPLPLNTSTAVDPLFYFTACALPNDPIRYC
ncbi:unnamed protein product [Rotaria sp. Silwood2]|nr:unnamed protein product [Rotaria sp. Silwood2]CAF4516802.1 unnamed protein product [Rotaria sp. Silwood2]